MSSNSDATPPNPEIGQGRQLTVDRAIADLQQQQDLGRRYYAAWWLGKFRINEPAAIDVLLEALEDEVDRAPDGGYPLRRNAARALGKLDERRVVPALIASLDCSDYYVRESAAQALGKLGDRAAAAALVKLLDGGVAAATRVPGKPHLVQPYDSAIEALGMLGATEAIATIQPFLQHSVERVSYAAARALYQLTDEVEYGDRLIAALRGSNLQSRRAALMDLGAIGYLPAAEPISQTLAENSLKLISLQGLLEHHLSDRGELSDRAVEIMTLMDSLL